MQKDAFTTADGKVTYVRQQEDPRADASISYINDPNGKTGSPYVTKFFTSDRLAREAFTFLAPENCSDDLVTMEPQEIGLWIAELGERLYEEGSLPGLPCWEKEESPEIQTSLAYWRECLEESDGPKFNELVQKCWTQAEAGFYQLGRLAPRLAGLRWAACVCWISCRLKAVQKASGGGGNIGSVSPAESELANRTAKGFIFKALGKIMSEPPVVALFDFDLMGQGVWHGGGKEPLPTEAEDEWFRRGNIFDLCRMAHQAVRIPPANMNPAVPHLILIQPYGTPNEKVNLPEVPRRVLNTHGWVAEMLLMPLEQLPQKPVITGRVLHMEIPPPPDFDLEDPETKAKVERGEDLGKGSQEDGLPGAVHGSIGLMYAATAIQEETENVWFYPGMLQLEGFMEMFLHYGPKLRSISLAGAEGKVDEDILSLITLGGDSVLTLDLEECGIDSQHIEGLMETLRELKGIRNLDLAGNHLDGPGILNLVRQICEHRVDLEVLRLDRNPSGLPEVLKNEIAASLATRGESVVAGGDLVLHLGDECVRWCAEPRDGTLAQRLRDDGADVVKTSSLKEMDQTIAKREAVWKKYEMHDPAAKSSGGRDWLRRMRLHNAKVNKLPLLKFYRRHRTWQANQQKKDDPVPAPKDSTK